MMPRSRRSYFAGAVLALVAPLVTALTLLASPLSAQPPGGDPVTILDRVFTEVQADRGESRFKQSCTGCHSAVQFAEPSFSQRWEGRTLGDVYAYISEAMPENDPGSLTPAQYADILAFFLGMSGYPVGYDELPADKAALQKIGVVPQPK